VIAAVAIGIGRTAADALIASSTSPAGSPGDLCFDQAAKVLGGINSADAYLRNSLRRLSVADPASPEAKRMKLDVRLAVINAGQSAAHATDICYRAAGSEALGVDSVTQRAWRDINTAIQHAAISTRSYARLGRDIATLPSS